RGGGAMRSASAPPFPCPVVRFHLLFLPPVP
ncbi:hypothetical protein A2U01_0069980, partial [Trifolium medium]|nr:hypothetical protein [Trifolium medium]